MTLWTPDYFVENVHADETEEYVRNYQAQSAQHNLDNYLVQTRAMTTHDVLGLAPFEDRHQQGQMQEKLLMIGFENDHMVNPQPAKALAVKLGSRYVNLPTNCGHMGSVCKNAEIADIVHAFLD